MGIQDIIKDGLDDAPTHDVFINDGASDDEDIPAAEIIYSDASSDTELPENDTIYSLSAIMSSSSSLTSLDDDALSQLLDQPHSNYNALAEEASVRTEVESPRPANVTELPTNATERVAATESVRKFKNIRGKSRQSVGKKKARRIENARQLDLMRGDDDSGGCDINDFMPVDCSFRFTQILDDVDLANKVLNPSVDIYDDRRVTDTIKTRGDKNREQENFAKRKKLSAHAAFNNLYASEKDLFRRRNLPLGMVQYLDACVLSFFGENPTGTYVSEPLSSFERLMLHSIAHFYELKSNSFNVDDHRCRLTKVTNSFDYFDPPCLCLSEYIERLTAKEANSNSRRCKRFRRK